MKPYAGKSKIAIHGLKQEWKQDSIFLARADLYIRAVQCCELVRHEALSSADTVYSLAE